MACEMCGMGIGSGVVGAACVKEAADAKTVTARARRSDFFMVILLWIGTHVHQERVTDFEFE